MYTQDEEKQMFQDWLCWDETKGKKPEFPYFKNFKKVRLPKILKLYPTDRPTTSR